MAPPNSLPKWALTSFPGSGVTWTRQMIEGLTGIYTGSVHLLDPAPYKDKCNILQNPPPPKKNTEISMRFIAIENAGFGVVDDPFCNCTIIDKDHEATETFFGKRHYLQLLHEEVRTHCTILRYPFCIFPIDSVEFEVLDISAEELVYYAHSYFINRFYSNINQEYSNIINTTYNYRGVLLLRNPMDVVFTYRHCMLEGKVGVAALEAFRGPEWDEIVNFVAFAWADHAIRWIEQIKNGTVVFYENLLGDNAQLELERFLEAMDFKPWPIDPDRMRCTLAHRHHGDYKRVDKPRYLTRTFALN